MMMRALCSKKEERRKKKEFNIFCQDLEDEIIKDKEAKKIVLLLVRSGWIEIELRNHGYIASYEIN